MREIKMQFDETQLRKITKGFNDMAAAMRGFSYGLSKVRRGLTRLDYTRGDRHVERVVRAILAGEPGRDPAVRLSAAIGLAEVLDAQPRHWTDRLGS